MTKEEAASFIETIGKSLKDNPTQFQTNLHVTVNQGKSCVVDLSSYQGEAEVRIAQEAGIDKIKEQMEAAIDLLNNIATQLRSRAPDKGKISNYLRALKDWLPPVVTSVVANLISAAIGI
jgi:predicted GTPase